MLNMLDNILERFINYNFFYISKTRFKIFTWAEWPDWDKTGIVWSCVYDGCLWEARRLYLNVKFSARDVTCKVDLHKLFQMFTEPKKR